MRDAAVADLAPLAEIWYEGWRDAHEHILPWRCASTARASVHVRAARGSGVAAALIADAEVRLASVTRSDFAPERYRLPMSKPMP